MSESDFIAGMPPEQRETLAKINVSFTAELLDNRAVYRYDEREVMSCI